MRRLCFGLYVYPCTCNKICILSLQVTVTTAAAGLHAPYIVFEESESRSTTSDDMTQATSLSARNLIRQAAMTTDVPLSLYQDNKHGQQLVQGTSQSVDVSSFQISQNFDPTNHSDTISEVLGVPSLATSSGSVATNKLLDFTLSNNSNSTFSFSGRCSCFSVLFLTFHFN